MSQPLRLNRNDFQAYADTQPQRRFERVNGEVVAMSPERAAHVRVKVAVCIALKQAIAAAGLPCEAFGDGMTVEVGDEADYEPDALVNCGAPIAGDSTVAPSPIIVVEVLSPSTSRTDTTFKLMDYFKVPSIQHYLIVRAERPEVIHHMQMGTEIRTRLLTAGVIELSPPGIRVNVADFYG